MSYLITILYYYDILCSGYNISKYLTLFNSTHVSFLPFARGLQWFTLNDIKHGRVHLVVEWLPTVTQRDKLEQVSLTRDTWACAVFIQHWPYSERVCLLQVMQMQSSQSYQNKSVASAALLFILLDRAHQLPVSHSHVSVISLHLSPSIWLVQSILYNKLKIYKRKHCFIFEHNQIILSIDI